MRHGHRLCIAALVAVALALIAPGRQDPLAAGATIHVDADATSGAKTAHRGTTPTPTCKLLWTQPQPGNRSGWRRGPTRRPAEHGGTGDRVQVVPVEERAWPSTADSIRLWAMIAFEDRDWEETRTILSGDLNGDDGPDFANNGENSYHVFYHPAGTDLDSTAILDGFTVTGGNADGSLPTTKAAGCTMRAPHRR